MVLPIVSIFREEVGKLVAAIRDRIPLMASVKSFGVEAALSASDVRKVAEEVARVLRGETPQNPVNHPKL